MSRLILLPAMVATLAALPTAASAAEIAFSGSMTGPAIVAANVGCAPIPFQGVLSGGVGTSSFGSFTYGHTVCTSGQGGGPIVGNYVIDFGVDQFSGTLSGLAQPSTTVAGTSNLFISYLITGGTGRFLGATGAFNAVGTADPRVRPSIVSLTFSAVPEPASWLMMLIGFGIVGASMRRRQPVTAVLRTA